MGVEVVGMLAADEMVATLDVTTKKRIVKKLIVAGHQLMLLARKMAPRDEGNLEEAIQMNPDPDKPGRERDDLGRFARTEVEVYVDMEAPVPERPGKVVGDYAYEVHEHVTPMGEKNLGEKSIEKQLVTPEVEVGGGYMTRAADMVEAGLDALLIEALFGE